MHTRAAVVAMVALFAGFVRAEDASKKLVISKDEQAIIDETNAERKKLKLPALRPNLLLFNAARLHSANMAKEKQMEHHLYNKGVAERMDDVGYKAMAGRENIAFDYAGPKEVVDGWMHSEGHKVNILADDVAEIGVGIVKDADGHPYYTQVFGLSEKDKVSVKFSVKNSAKKAISMELGGDKPSVVQPGKTGTYSVFAAVPAASVTIQIEELTAKTVKVKTGGMLVVDVKDNEITVTGDTK